MRYMMYIYIWHGIEDTGIQDIYIHEYMIYTFNNFVSVSKYAPSFLFCFCSHISIFIMLRTIGTCSIGR